MMKIQYKHLLITLGCLLAAPLASAKQDAAASAERLSHSQLVEMYSKAPQNWPAPVTADNIAPKPLAPLTLIGPAPEPKQVVLGEKLFHDKILSRDKTVSCSSCHDKNLQFSDGKTKAIGIDNQIGTRNAPAIIGIDHWKSFFWDGRTETALQQALQPIENPIEMDLSVEDAVKRLNADANYVKEFNDVFGKSPITDDQLAQAIVAFERTIDVPDTRYQDFIKQAYQDPKQAVSMLNERELEGLHLYRTKAKCMTCHEGPLLSDNEFHVTGFHFYGRPFTDLGRYEITKKVEDSGKFRTPTLLAVTKTIPWMHTGLFIEFGPMIEQYNRGGFRPRKLEKWGEAPLFPETSELLHKLHLSKDEMKSLIAFLETL